MEDKKPIDQFNPWEQYTTSTGKPRSDFFLRMQEAVQVKLNSLEEYEEIATAPDDVLVLLNDTLEQCNVVYGIPPTFLRYANKKFQMKRVAGTVGAIDHALEQGITAGGYDLESVPLIPIMEYKLVPTGFVSWYDPTKTRRERFNDRKRHSDYQVKRRKGEIKKHPGGRPKKVKPEEEMTRMDETEGEEL